MPTLIITKTENRQIRSREEIWEGIFNKEVRVGKSLLQPKQADPLKLQLAILETLLDQRDLLKKLSEMR